MSLTDLWRSMKDRQATQKSAPGNEALPRMRESTRLQAIRQAPKAAPATDRRAPSLGDITPFAKDIREQAAAAVAPPCWQDLFPRHHRALVADLAKRGESLDNWAIQDGREQGVSEAGHTVAFTLHKIGTSAIIRVELTLYKGQLSQVRVR